jgi:rare lipoprotein A (peptidoglycan hydrolase)
MRRSRWLWMLALAGVILLFGTFAAGFKLGLASGQDQINADVMRGIGASNNHAAQALTELGGLVDRLDRILSGGARKGIASWYAEPFSWRLTASGEPFDPEEMSAASRELPLGSYALLQNLENHRAVIVKINDRGPYVDGRLIDLSRAAARALGIERDGIALVRITPIAKEKT